MVRALNCEAEKSYQAYILPFLLLLFKKTTLIFFYIYPSMQNTITDWNELMMR